MTEGDTGSVTVARLLREAIDAKKVSVRELGRRVATILETDAESGRRAVQRWLGGTVPREEQARALAQALGEPEETYVTAARVEATVKDLLIEIRQALTELAEEFRASDARLRGTRAQHRVVDRLEALEGRVVQSGQDTTRALASLAKAIRTLERRLGREDPPAKQPQAR